MQCGEEFNSQRTDVIHFSLAMTFRCAFRALCPRFVCVLSDRGRIRALSLRALSSRLHLPVWRHFREEHVCGQVPQGTLRVDHSAGKRKSNAPSEEGRARVQGVVKGGGGVTVLEGAPLNVSQTPTNFQREV